MKEETVYEWHEQRVVWGKEVVLLHSSGWGWVEFMTLGSRSGAVCVELACLLIY